MCSLGWTGDIQVFTPTASYLFDTSGFLSNWLHDISEETLKDNKNVPPVVSPDVLNHKEVSLSALTRAWHLSSRRANSRNQSG